jgi:hypothetical protein
LKVLYAVNCDHAEELEDGRLAAHGIFHELYTRAFPAEHKLFLVVVIEWEAGDEGHRDFRIDLMDPTGTPTGTIRANSDVRARVPGRPPPRSPLVMYLDPVIFPQPGRYVYHLVLDGQVTEVAPLHLIVDEDAI